MRRTAWIGIALIAAAGALAGCGNSGKATGLVNQGIVDFNAQRYADAQANFAQAVELSPEHPDALFFLGRTHHVQGRFARAEYFYQCCMDAAPGYPGVRKRLKDAQGRIGAYGDRLRFIPDPIKK